MRTSVTLLLRVATNELLRLIANYMNKQAVPSSEVRNAPKRSGISDFYIGYAVIRSVEKALKRLRKAGMQ